MTYAKSTTTSEGMEAGESNSGWMAFPRYLVEKDKLNAGSLEHAAQVALESGERIELVLTRLGLVTERDLTDALAQFLSLPQIGIADYPQTPIFEGTFSRYFLKEWQIIPLRDSDDCLDLAVVTPLDTYASEAASFVVGKPIRRFLTYPADFEAAYIRLYGEGGSEIDHISATAAERHGDSTGDAIERLKESASDAPVIRLVNLLITRAVEARASDIHIEPMDAELSVRYRIDGVLQQVEAPPQRLASAIISRLKVMARLNIAERRLSQDGRIRIPVRGRDIDFRVSTTPTIHGESVVLRILDRSNLTLAFSALGLDEEGTQALRRLVNQAHGIALITGPTGSGKTTTLYTALLELNTRDRKILTVEDPVEYQLKGINQVQVKPQIGLSFANALRSFLRQDPDIMMVGEIRDLETAQVAVQAALTGHLILSTLHTNDAASAVTRLLDMGVEDYLLTSTINGVAAQRLVRTLCAYCREPYDVLPGLAERLDLQFPDGLPPRLYKPIGCTQCNGTGYFGRSSIMEVLTMTNGLRQLVLKHAEADLVRRIAVEEGMRTMQMHGLAKAVQGQTSLEEVIRVTRVI